MSGEGEEIMDGVFSNMIISHLKIEEILSVLFTTPEGKTQTAIFGVLDRIDNKLYIILINGDTVVVPISIFTYTITKPDFDKFRLVDYGYAIQFGDYEASMDFVLTHDEAIVLRSTEGV